MDCASIPVYGFLAFDMVSELELCSNKNKNIFQLEASHREPKWICSALPVGTAGTRVVGAKTRDNSHSQRISEKWISQLKKHLKQGKVDEAEEVMNRLLASGIRPNLLMYNSMLTINGKTNRFDAALSWFDRLEEDDMLKPNVVTYRSMIGACGRAGKLQEALSYYNKMRVLGFVPSTHNFNTLINLHRRHGICLDGWEERVQSLLSDMRELGCVPDSSTLDVIVKVYEKFQKIHNIPISLLEAAGWSPTCKCHSILLRSYVRCGQVDKALDEFYLLSMKSNMGPQDENPSLDPRKLLNVDKRNSMQTRDGSGHPPNTITDFNNYDDGKYATSKSLDEALCHSLICLCKSLGRYKEAMYVYNEMRQSGTHPSWLTACTIIDICGRINNTVSLETGSALFNEMRTSASGLQSTDAGAYTVTINMYLKANIAEKAAEISDMVIDHGGLEPDSALFLAMMKSYSRSNMRTKVVEVYKRMRNCKLNWTASLFNGVIHSCGRALPLEEITKVFLAMVHAKVPLSSVTCNLMMDIFAKAGLLEKSESVFRLAKEQGVINAISYNTIINAYGKFKEFNKMECALADMQSSGYKDNVEAYNSMIDAYGKAGRIRRMENVLECMRRAECLPDLSTFNILINVYGKERLVEQLYDVRKDMEEAGIKPNNYTFNTLIHAYGNAEMPDEAMETFKEMQNIGLEPDQITYHCLIRAFEKSGNDLEAARWSLWVEQLGLK